MGGQRQPNRNIDLSVTNERAYFQPERIAIMAKLTYSRGPSWLRGGKVVIVPAGARQAPTDDDSDKSEKKEASSDDEAQDEGERGLSNGWTLKR